VAEWRTDRPIERRLDEAQVIPDVRGPLLEVTFPFANTPRDIAHGCGAIPTGVEVVYQTACVTATPGALWTRDVAWLQAPAANARARVRFLVTQEVPREP
jgi:hypothetical protein